jgi:hypothetical protein
MKTLIKKAIHHAVQINWVWYLLSRTILPLAYHVQAARKVVVREKLPSPLNPIFATRTIMHGVFAGMKYPELTSINSALFPKLLGSYEKEIEPLLEVICDNQYSEIVDIGCAEGYYAVGLAMRIKTAKVFAFDTNIDAIRLCNEMAQLNDVSKRVITGSFCDAQTLLNLPLTKRALIISDCEGYEKELFSKDTVPFLAQYELLIEVHDFIDIEISSYLRELFELTHNIEVYSSIDDIKKAQQYAYKELESFSLEEKKQILREGRPAIMEWFYMEPRKRN